MLRQQAMALRVPESNQNEACEALHRAVGLNVPLTEACLAPAVDSDTGPALWRAIAT
jgi:hypothetical protein